MVKEIERKWVSEEPIDNIHSEIIVNTLILEGFMNAIISEYLCKDKSKEIVTLFLEKESFTFEERIRSFRALKLYDLSGCPICKDDYNLYLSKIVYIQKIRNQIAHNLIKIQDDKYVSKKPLSGDIKELDDNFMEKFRENYSSSMNNFLSPLINFIRSFNKK